MTTHNCIFCKIVKNEIPSNVLYEDNKIKIILDAFPSAEGHSLIITKEHYNHLSEVSDELLAHISKYAKKVSLLLKTNLNAKGINYLSNEGAIAGQSVFHFHFHVIPKYESEVGTKISFGKATHSKDTIDKLKIKEG